MQPGSFEKAKEKQRVLLADSLNFRDQEKKKKAEDQGGECVVVGATGKKATGVVKLFC